MEAPLGHLRSRNLLPALSALLWAAGCNKGFSAGPTDGGPTVIFADGGDGGGGTGHHDGGPAHDAGPIVYVDSGPTALLVSLVAPDRGPSAGGISVTLTGAGFLSGHTPTDAQAASAATVVTFAGNPALDVLVLSDSTLQLTLPAGATGAADVSVTNANGQQTCAGCFVYQSPIQIDQVTPALGPTAGGTALTVLGIGFDANTVLLVGGRRAIQTQAVSSTTLTALTPASASAGPVSVRAFNQNGLASLFNAFTYVAGPAIASATPSFGPLTGGTAVTLSGGGFLGQSLTITVGGALATLVAVQNDAALTFVTPPGLAGAQDLVVAGQGGQATLAKGFVYVDPSVTAFGVVAIVPSGGPAAGGTGVAVIGTGFPDGGFGVWLGDAGPVAAAPSTPNEAALVTPPGAVGTVDVAADGGTFAATALAGFTYLPERTVVQVQPASGPSAGGTAITVNGAGFLPGDTLRVGPLPATQVAVVSATELTAVTPAGSAGPADVTLLAADGGAPATLPGGFTYEDPLALVQVSPASGSQAGGTYVQLLGTGFGLGDTAAFGGAPAQDVQLLDAFTLSCLAPPGTPGPVDVTLAGPGDAGQSTLGGGYAYFDPTNTSGGQNGGPLDGTLNVTVLSSSGFSYGQPVVGATVRLGLDPQSPFQGLTDAHGQITFSDPTLVKPQTVTATFEGIAATVDDVTQQNLTLLLSVALGTGGGGLPPCPCSQNGEPPNCPNNCGLPFCGLFGTCVQCLSDGDCANPSNPGYDPSKPHCFPPGGLGGACVHCVSDSDCVNDPNGHQACDNQRGTQSSFTCVACTANSFCPMGDYCDTQTVTCVPSDLIEGNVYGFKLPPGVSLGAMETVEAHVGLLQPAVYYFEPFGPPPQEFVVSAEGGSFAFQIDAQALNLALYAKFGVKHADGSFTPYLLGVTRGVVVDPQHPAMGVVIILDTHLDQAAPLGLLNTLAPPPLFVLRDGGAGGSATPVSYDTFAYLNLGQDGVLPLNDVTSDGGTASLGGLPPLQGNGLLFLTQAFQDPGADPSQRPPTSNFFRSVDSDFTAGVPMGPLLPFVIPVHPVSGGTLDGTFQWSFAGSTPPARPPELTRIDLAYEQVATGSTTPTFPTVLWDIVVPGTQTEVQIPNDLLHQILTSVPTVTGYTNYFFWQIDTANAPRFNYAFFTYGDLSPNAWTGYQSTSSLASP